MDYVVPVATAGVITVGSYYTYYYVRNMLTGYVMNRVNEKFGEMQNKEGVTFKTFEKSKSALIVFSHGGRQHHVSVPYDKTKGRKMARKRVFLVTDNADTNNEERIEITHKQGVPYLLSAAEMGGCSIVVEKDNKTLITYSKDDIPTYLDSI